MEERKKQLLKRLAEISVKISATQTEIMSNKGNKIMIRSDYDPAEFGYHLGQFVLEKGCCYSRLGICVGVGIGCPKNPTNEELWFLWENNEKGISHFCGGRASDFAKDRFFVAL